MTILIGNKYDSMNDAIVIDPDCKDSMRKAAEKLQISVEALKDALNAFGRSMASIGNHAIAAFEEIADQLKEQKEADCDEQLQLPSARFESLAAADDRGRAPARPMQLESSYG